MQEHLKYLGEQSHAMTFLSFQANKEFKLGIMRALAIMLYTEASTETRQSNGSTSNGLEANKEIKLGAMKAVWWAFYGTPRSQNEMETIIMILALLEKDPPTTNPYWTLSDLQNNIKKTYADIQKAVQYLENTKTIRNVPEPIIETSKNWLKNQGNKRYIKLTFKGNDYIKFCKKFANKQIKELEEQLKEGKK